MAGAQCPSSPGGEDAWGQCWWTDRHLAPLTSVPASLSLSLVVRNPGTSVPRVRSQDRKLPNFFPTWPNFILADGRPCFSRYINQTGIWRETQVGDVVGLSTPKSQL